MGYPIGISHEFLGDLFHTLSQQGNSYPEVYEGIRLMQGGSADVQLSKGRKQPDFSLYETAGDGRVLPTVPTLAGEVGDSEDNNKLTLDAARLICLSRGDVRLVITVKFIRKQIIGGNAGVEKQLSKIIWGHWELVGVDSVEMGESTDCLNSPKATEWDSEEFPTKYIAMVQHSKSRFLRYTARLVRTYKVSNSKSCAHIF